MTPDAKAPVWLLTQQLAHAMDEGGVSACAQVAKDILEARRDDARALAYRLFTIADKRGWQAEAFSYNSLVSAWPEVQDAVARMREQTPAMNTLFD